MLALVLAGGIGWHFQRTARLQTFVAAHLPTPPDLSHQFPPLRESIRAATRRARAGDDAPAALATLSRLYHANGFLAEAAACYVALATLQPHEPRWAHRHATLLAAGGDTSGAITQWERAITLAPDTTLPRLRVGDMLLQTHDVVRAAFFYRSALALSPHDPHALLGLARCAIATGRWDEAREGLERVVGLTQAEFGHDLLATVYAHLGLPAPPPAPRRPAPPAPESAAAPDPWMDELYNDCYDAARLAHAAATAERAGDLSRALRWLQRALRVAPSDATLHYQLGCLLLGLDETDEAHAHLQYCLQFDPSRGDAWAKLVGLRRSTGDHQGADQLLVVGLEHAPNTPALQLLHARRADETGQTVDAIRAYQRVLELQPADAESRVALALLQQQVGATAEALVQLHAALALEPDHPAALNTLALHALGAGDESAARHWLLRARDQPRVPRDHWLALAARYHERFGRALD